MQQQYVVIVAGGTGSRIQSGIPKQFVKLNGKEIILYTIEKFLEFNKEIKIIIAAHEEYIDYLNNLLRKKNINDVCVVKGGNTRYHSVKNALEAISDSIAIVGIHDAARPMVSLKTIRSCYQTATQKGNAIPVVVLNESIREVLNEKNKAVNRNLYKVVQTPQCFLVEQIKKAFELPYNENFTDDASVLEANGGTIHLVEGNEENIKITLPKDLLIAKLFLENE